MDEQFLPSWAVALIGASLAALLLTLFLFASLVAYGRSASEPSAAIKSACTADVQRLCPKEYAARNNEQIARCMREHKSQISFGCMAAWIKEHGLSQ